MRTAILLIVAGLSGAALAAPGDLDTSFGTGGKLVHSGFPNNEYVGALARQPDGKLVAAGFGSHRFALARYNTDGSLDATFGSGGKVAHAVGVFSDTPYAIALQGDGKIVVAGASRNGGGPEDFAIVRYNANGTPDTGFGTGGVAVVAVHANVDWAYALAIQPDGMIVAAGHAWNGSNSDFAVVRLTAAGAPDATFGAGGIVTFAMAAADNQAAAIAVQPDAKILVAGHAGDGGNRNFALARLNADGTLDASFGTAGKVLTLVGTTSAAAHAMVLQGDGKVVLAGSSTSGVVTGFAFARFNADGTLDPAFGSGGKVQVPMANGGTAYAVALRPDGRILAAGECDYTTQFDTCLAQLNANGSVDTSFGGGTTAMPLGPEYNVARALVLQPDGMAVVAGASDNGYTLDFALTRVTPTAGRDTTFGAGGFVTTDLVAPAVLDFFYGLAIRNDSKLVLTGPVQMGLNQTDFAAVRFHTDGTLDYGFGAQGMVTSQVGVCCDVSLAVVTLPDGRTVVGGHAWNEASEFGLLRYTPSGTLDASFGTGGTLTTNFVGGAEYLSGIARMPDGRIVAVGYMAPGGAANRIAVARYFASGALDPSFGTGGMAVLDPAGESELVYSMALQRDGKILIGGSLYTGTQYLAFVMRLLQGGAPDPGFGTNGVVLVGPPGFNGAYGLSVQRDGRIVAALLGYPLTLVRLMPDGSPDATFGTAGVVSASFNVGASARALAIQPDGRIVTAGQTNFDFSGNYDFIVARFNGDGSTDTTFGTNGATSIDFGPLNDEAIAIALQCDGKIVVAGAATGVGGGAIARLHGTPPPFGKHVNDMSADCHSDILLKGPSGEIVNWLMDGYTITEATLLAGASGYVVTHVTDVSGDRKADLLLRGPAGEIVLWTLDGATVTSSTLLLGAGSGYEVLETGDFNGDGIGDLLLGPPGGPLVMWLMNGATVMQSATLPSGTMQPVAIGDFNGDGKADIVLMGPTGNVTLWLMDGINVISQTALLGGGTGYVPKHVADFNGDGKADILFEGDLGDIVLWLMDGATITSSTLLLGTGTGYTAIHAPDLDGDLKADLVLRGPSGQIVTWMMNGASIVSSTLLYAGGTGWNVSHVGDYDASGSADLLLKGPNGEIVVWLMSGPAIVNSTLLLGISPWLAYP